MPTVVLAPVNLNGCVALLLVLQKQILPLLLRLSFFLSDSQKQRDPLRFSKSLE